LSCGFPQSGLDKYVGKLLRCGEGVEIAEHGEVVEKIELKKGGAGENGHGPV
jgi:DNA mismatch repair ATPase MutS